jgi:ABC-type glycerol-3-phosphate transport system permease component
MVVERPIKRYTHVAAVVAIGLVIGAPFYWLLITALKTSQEALSYPPTWIPTTIRWENFGEAIQLLSATTFVNSIIFTISVTMLQLILVICGGFALAKMPFPGRRWIFMVMLATMFVPFHVMLIPTFLIVRGLSLIDTWPGLVVPIVAQTAFGTFLFRQFFVALPDELLEAARIDGASWGQMFALIAAPLAGPPVAAYVSVTTLNAWNMYVWPLVATYDPDMRVLPLALASLGGERSIIPPNVAMMAVLISTLPIMIIFIAAQKWFVSGLGGAIKE